MISPLGYLLGSLVGHGLILWFLWFLALSAPLAPRLAPGPAPRPIEFTRIERIQHPLAQSLRSQPSAQSLRSQPSAQSLRNEHPAGARVATTVSREPGPAGPQGTQPKTQQGNATPGSVNLFPSEVLGKIAAPSEPPGASGKDGPADRIATWARQKAGEERVRSGLVPPVFAKVERDAERLFAPTPELVTDKGRGRLLFSQWQAARPQGGEVPRGVDSVRYSGNGTVDRTEDAKEQLQAGLAALANPAEFAGVEIEAVLEEAGEIRSLTVVRTSGRKALDQLALSALRRALSLQRFSPRSMDISLKGATRSRWLVSASVSVTPPAISPLVEATGPKGQVVGATMGMGLSFDESLGHLKPKLPFERKVKTQVKLLSLLKEESP